MSLIVRNFICYENDMYIFGEVDKKTYVVVLVDAIQVQKQKKTIMPSV